jgi:hypothetical protein
MNTRSLLSRTSLFIFCAALPFTGTRADTKDTMEAKRAKFARRFDAVMNTFDKCQYAPSKITVSVERAIIHDTADLRIDHRGKAVEYSSGGGDSSTYTIDFSDAHAEAEFSYSGGGGSSKDADCLTSLEDAKLCWIYGKAILSAAESARAYYLSLSEGEKAPDAEWNAMACTERMATEFLAELKNLWGDLS